LEQNYESLKKENDVLKADLEDALRNRPMDKTTSSKRCPYLTKREKVEGGIPKAPWGTAVV
jgi:hypothetical protein